MFICVTGRESNHFTRRFFSNLKNYICRFSRILVNIRAESPGSFCRNYRVCVCVCVVVVVVVVVGGGGGGVFWSGADVICCHQRARFTYAWYWYFLGIFYLNFRTKFSLIINVPKENVSNPWYKMMTSWNGNCFLHRWPLMSWIHRSLVVSIDKRPEIRSFDVFLSSLPDKKTLEETFEF